ncbi:hypothetical protein [Chromobacterium violaceum]|uniref:hypothetical protein n=1 Tax=Chromobacterium violaceum TaxID=536 RepID=UPI003CF54A4D
MPFALLFCYIKRAKNLIGVKVTPPNRHTLPDRGDHRSRAPDALDTAAADGKFCNSPRVETDCPWFRPSLFRKTGGLPLAGPFRIQTE